MTRVYSIENGRNEKIMSYMGFLEHETHDTMLESYELRGPAH